LDSEPHIVHPLGTHPQSGGHCHRLVKVVMVEKELNETGMSVTVAVSGLEIETGRGGMTMIDVVVVTVTVEIEILIGTQIGGETMKGAGETVTGEEILALAGAGAGVGACKSMVQAQTVVLAHLEIQRGSLAIWQS